MSPIHETSTDFCEHVQPRIPTHPHASPRERHANALRLLAGGMVDVYVGASRKHYQLHKTLLCHRSAFFHSAFRGPFKEAVSSTLSMVDDAPEVFDLVVRWMYKGTIDPCRLEHRNNNNNSSSGVVPLTHLQLFVLADKLQMLDLQDRALDAIRTGLRHADAYLGPVQLIYVLYNTPPTSALRKFALEMTAFAMCRMRVKVETFRPCFEESPVFASEMMGAVLATFPGYQMVQDPRGGLSVCDWGPNGVYRDPGNSMRANVSQAGSDDFPDLSSPPAW